MRPNYPLFTAVLVFLSLTGSDANAAVKYSNGEIRSVETEREFQITKLRNGEIQQLRIAIGHRMSNNRKADLYFRLAELYLEAYRANFILEGRVHDKRLKSGRKEVVVDRSRSKPFLKKGIEACSQILKLAPKYSKLDRVIYFLAFNYDEIGNQSKSSYYYNKIIEDFPRSPFRVEAYRELGGYAFKKNDYKKAQVYYQLALKVPNSGKQPEIMHALAWSYYRTRQFNRAIKMLKAAIKTAMEDQEQYLSIQEEALRDMAIFMTETGQVEEAIDYFKSVAGDKAFFATTLEKLGKEYERKIQPEKAVKVYEALMRARPDSESAFRVLVKLVDLDLRRGAYVDVLKRVEKQEVSFSDDVETKVARNNLMSKIRRTATDQHEKYRKTKSKTNRILAQRYYEVYLKKFLVTETLLPEKREIQMYLAELKMEDESYYEAAKIYKEVFDSQDRRYYKEAGILWIGALSKQLAQVAKMKGQKNSNAPSEAELSFIKAADRLYQKVPDSKDTREALLRSTQILAGYEGTKRQAQKRAKIIIERYPQTQQAQLAAILWLQLKGDELDVVVEKYPEKYLETADQTMKVIEEIENNAELIEYARSNQGTELFKELSSRKLGLRVGIIKVYERRGDEAKAGREYLEYANEAPNKQTSEKAFQGAFRTFLAAKAWSDLDRTVGDWLVRFPKNSQGSEFGRKAATLFFIHGKFRLSATRFEKLGLHSKDHRLLQTAERIYHSIGDWSRSRAVLLTLLADYKRNVDLGETYFALFEVEQKLGNTVAAEGALENCQRVSASLKAKCGAKLADLYFQSGRNKEAKNVYLSVARLRKGRTVSPYVSYAQYQLSYMMEREKNFVALELPEPILKDGLAERMDFLKKLKASYLQSVQLGGVWGISALYRIGKWIIDLASEIDKIAPPISMTPDERKIFDKTLASFSKPLKDQAIGLWDDALKRSRTSMILSPSLPKISNELNMVNPKKYPMAQGFRGKMRLAGKVVSPTNEEQKNIIETVRANLTKNPRSDDDWLDYGNLLWFGGNHRLAEFCYDRALALNKKDAAAINNRAVVALLSTGFENWETVQEVYQQLLIVEKSSKHGAIGKFNIASLLNYYRLFPVSVRRWKEIVASAQFSDAYDGYAIALYGTGKKDLANRYFKLANDLGASVDRFAYTFHQSARLADSHNAECSQSMSAIPKESLRGFEIVSLRSLERTCGQWKKSN